MKGGKEMKRSFFTGAILGAVVVGILFACTDVFTMSHGGSKQMVITADTQTGEIVSIVDEKGNKATRVDPEELEKIYKSEDGLKFVGTILYGHSSPGCFYVVLGGWGFKICVG
jgi:hypothetical protein